MVAGVHRPTVLRIDTQAIIQNVQNEFQRMPKGTELFAVVKANGYGHGAIEVAKASKKGGATGFCTAILDEALELREAGFLEPILVLSVVDLTHVLLAVQNDISLTGTTQEWLETAVAKLASSDAKKPLRVHIKVDSGMGRIGFLTPDKTKQAVAYIKSSKELMWEGIFTHFATADEEDNTYFNKQAERFNAVLEVIGTLPKYVHVSNSATALWHPGVPGNMIRFGVATYGLNPSGTALKPPFELKPALTLTSALIQVKLLAAGEGIGYGKTYVTPKDEWIGTVPIGYADGFLRHMGGFTLLVKGKRCEIVGRVCMDTCMIRLSEEVPTGTLVTIVGKDGNEENTLQMLADKLGTINYEVACTFSQRIPREYTNTVVAATTTITTTTTVTTTTTTTTTTKTVSK